MAKNETTRLKPGVLAADMNGFAALQDIKDYAPANPAYSQTNVAAAKAKLDNARTIEAQKKAEADAARDDAVAAEWDFHNAMLAVGDQVAAQYGKNSNQWQSLGRKKPTEYKTRTRPAKK